MATPKAPILFSIFLTFFLYSPSQVKSQSSSQDICNVTCSPSSCSRLITAKNLTELMLLNLQWAINNTRGAVKRLNQTLAATANNLQFQQPLLICMEQYSHAAAHLELVSSFVQSDPFEAHSELIMANANIFTCQANMNNAGFENDWIAETNSEFMDFNCVCDTAIDILINGPPRGGTIQHHQEGGGV